MEAVYYWTGFAVIWALAAAASLAVLWLAGQIVWQMWLAKLRSTPTTWAFYYLKRALGHYRYRKGYFTLPTRLNSDQEIRNASKERMMLVRNIQANIFRFNRRRYA